MMFTKILIANAAKSLPIIETHTRWVSAVWLSFRCRATPATWPWPRGPFASDRCQLWKVIGAVTSFIEVALERRRQAFPGYGFLSENNGFCRVCRDS